jgi:hemerythrin-like metal-binding protein
VPMQSLQPIWRPEYASGNEALDEEHRALFAKLSAFLAQSPRRESHAQVLAFDVLVDECAEHFRHEEALLQSVGYPRLTRHAAIHAMLLSKCEQVRVSLPAPPALLEVMAGRLSEMIVAHLLSADMDYYPYLAPSAPTPANRRAAPD